VATSFLDELSWRGLLHQRTAGAELDAHVAASGRVAYSGFDPTSDSLTIGNLIPITLLRHWQRAGHRPIALMGGGTGLIGDPSGRDAERQLMSREQVEANVASQRRIMERLLDFSAGISNRASIVNNLDWLGKLGYLEVLRDVGKHFSINEMIQRDSVKRRLEQREHGISYTEFSYALLQAYDFLHLYRAERCTVQLAGSDQYGNIVAGIDLIRREARTVAGAAHSFGVTAPLVTRSDGRKMSKSEGGAVWLSSDTAMRTSPYAFYQYWINLPDEDVIQWMKWYTMLERAEIEAIAAEHGAAPEQRRAQRMLAAHMTKAVHGQDELARVEAATSALFGGGDVRSLDAAMLEEVFADVPHSTHPLAALAGEGASLVDVLAETTLVKSKREAREFLQSGAVSVNGVKAEADRRLRSGDLLHGRTILLKRGKKHWHATRWG
jgi:tyrosyl-tRNA synthetase